VNTPDTQQLAQAIQEQQKQRPQDRTFKLVLKQGQIVWIKTPSQPRLRLLYTITNRIMVWLNMPYFQAPPHAGAPGGKASLQIEKDMLMRLKAANLPVPEIVASTDGWLALSSTGEENLDVILGHLPIDERLLLWQQAATEIARVHGKKCCLSQCFARNIMLAKKQDSPQENTSPSYNFYFLDFEEDPTAIMTLAQAQARDWAMFLHSTATLISADREPAQQFMLNLLSHESLETQQAIQQIFKHLKTLRHIKSVQWLGRDSIRIYQLGVFADGIYQKLREQKNLL